VSKKDRKPSTALAVQTDNTNVQRADIKAMVQRAREGFHDEVMKVLSETGVRAAELERAIGDVSQIEALLAVREFFNDELDRQLAKY
jgi:hypothetical protein